MYNNDIGENTALILYKNNIQPIFSFAFVSNTALLALILYKNNIQQTKKGEKVLKQFALILYKNNIQQQIFAIYVVFYYKNGYKHFKIQ